MLGLGFAAARDLGAFLKAEAKDDAGHDNPALVANAKTIVMDSSQSGRFVRSLIQLGYNRDEQGRIVFDGAFPHIGGGLMPHGSASRAALPAPSRLIGSIRAPASLLRTAARPIR